MVAFGMKTRFAPAVLLFPLLLTSTLLQADQPHLRGANAHLFPDEKIIIEFVFSEPLVTKIGPVDFFDFSAGASFTNWEEGSFIITRMFNGHKLLAATAPSEVWPTYRSSKSVFNGIPVEFDQILEEDFFGVFEIDPVFVKPRMNSSIYLPMPEIITGTAVTRNSFWQGPPGTIVSCRIVDAPFSDGFEDEPDSTPCFGE